LIVQTAVSILLFFANDTRNIIESEYWMKRDAAALSFLFISIRNSFIITRSNGNSSDKYQE